jgi:hypothetical protein
MSAALLHALREQQVGAALALIEAGADLTQQFHLRSAGCTGSLLQVAVQEGQGG